LANPEAAARNACKGVAPGTAIEHDDPAEAWRILAEFAFSGPQRLHLDRLIDDWEHRRDRRSHPAGLLSGRELDQAHPGR
jgi:hypothetical protein